MLKMKLLGALRDSIITTLITAGGIYHFFNGDKTIGIICSTIGFWLIFSAFWNSRKHKG